MKPFILYFIAHMGGGLTALAHAEYGPIATLIGIPFAITYGIINAKWIT